MANYPICSMNRVAEHIDTQQPLACCRLHTADVRCLRPGLWDSGKGESYSNLAGATKQPSNALMNHNDDTSHRCDALMPQNTHNFGRRKEFP
jgi:hypothetical protein